MMIESLLQCSSMSFLIRESGTPGSLTCVPAPAMKPIVMNSGAMVWILASSLLLYLLGAMDERAPPRSTWEHVWARYVIIKV